MAHDDVICEWLGKNHLEANASKTKYIVFVKSERKAEQVDDFDFELLMNGQPLDRVRSMLYLGVIVDDKLHWDQHVSKVKNEIAPYVFALRKMRPYVTEYTAIMVYNAFIGSRLVYVSPAWHTAANNKLQGLRVLQHAALRTIRRLPWLTPSHTLFTEKLLSIDNLFRCRLLLFIHKIAKEEIRNNFDLQLVSQVHEYPTRNRINWKKGRKDRGSKYIEERASSLQPTTRHQKRENSGLQNQTTRTSVGLKLISCLSPWFLYLRNWLLDKPQKILWAESTIELFSM